MDYYINEYSLRGQFEGPYDFFESLRTHTIPVLDKVKKEKDSVIWKSAVLWKCEVCEGVSLNAIPSAKNERGAELTKMKMLLRDLYSREPFWFEDALNEGYVLEYGFDLPHRDFFSNTNCFTNAWRSEGRVLSFRHPEYVDVILPLTVIHGDDELQIELDNIHSVDWWKKCPEIKRWRFGGRYTIEVRGKEFEYHPPHFHASISDYQAAFHLKTGEFYIGSGEKAPMNFIKDINEWYAEHKEELEEAWSSLHPPVAYHVTPPR